MIRAIARIERYPLVTGVAYRITSCPDAPEFEARIFAAPRRAFWRDGECVSVRFHPDDQYANEG